MDIDEKLCACFVDRLKTFGHVNWTKLMLILKETSIDWHEKILIVNCTWVRVLKYSQKKGEMKCEDWKGS